MGRKDEEAEAEDSDRSNLDVNDEEHELESRGGKLLKLLSAILFLLFTILFYAFAYNVLSTILLDMYTLRSLSSILE